MRSPHPETSARLPQWIEEIVASICRPYGARYEIDYQRGVPTVQNAPELSQLIELAAQEAWGYERVQVYPSHR